MTTYIISSGIVSSGLTLGPGDLADVLNGGEILSSTDAGTEAVFLGGSASATTVDSGGAQDVYSGGMTTGATVLSGGAVILFSGAVAGGVTVDSGGAVEFGTVVVGGATLDLGAMSSGGQQIASTTTTSDGVTILSGGEIRQGYQILSGGTVSGVGPYYGVVDVASGGAAIGGVVGSGGQEILETGAAVASGTTVRFDGALTIDPGVLPGDLALWNGSELDVAGVTATTVTLNPSGQLVLVSGGVDLRNFLLTGDVLNVELTTTTSNGDTLISLSPTGVREDFNGDGKSDFLIENTNGAVVVGEVGGGGEATYAQVAALGPEWTFVGAGDFLGDSDQGFLIENTSGAVVVGEVFGGRTTYTQVAALGPEWAFHN